MMSKNPKRLCVHDRFSDEENFAQIATCLNVRFEIEHEASPGKTQMFERVKSKVFFSKTDLQFSTKK